jgi:hypothetical protein
MLRPVSVALPVATTTAVARPAATAVPSYSIEHRSAIARAGTGAVVLSTGKDSPVSDDSST